MDEERKDDPELTEENLNNVFGDFVRGLENKGKQAVPDPKKKPDKKPKKEPFLEYNTLFKLSVLQKIGVEAGTCGPRFVECVACGWGCELESILLGEVSQYQCPACKITTYEYYSDKLHQEDPDA